MIPYRTLRRAALAGAAWLAALPASRAADFSPGDGWQVNLDTTLSSGVSFRASPVDYRFVGIANGGATRAPNFDDGTLNFRNSPVVAAPQRITEELDIRREDWGAFVRATAFYDPVYDSETPDFKPFPRATVRDLGADARLLDAFVYGATEAFGDKINFKLGNQVINWGESLFLSGGINSATPFDANALESPGTELKEAVLPVPAIDATIGLARNLSLEGFYEFYWVRTRFAPDGSYFDQNDSISDGGRYGIEDAHFPDSIGIINDLDTKNRDPYGPLILRGVDEHPPNQGEFGAALRYTSPYLNDSELGLYFENYHSRTPVVSWLTGSEDAAISDNHKLLGAPGITYNSTARYFADYPADIHLLGASFSSSLPGGFGVQGEISNRFNQPLVTATADAVLQLEAPYLCQLGPYLSSLGLGVLAVPANTACAQARRDPAILAEGGVPGFDQHYNQYKRYDVTQAQVSATKLLPPVPSLGITGMTLIAELGINTIPNFPRDAGILDSDFATSGSSAFATAATVHGVLQSKNLITQTAAGGTAFLSADMPHALPYGIFLQPYIAFSAGLFGRDATGAGPFQEGQDSVAIGANFSYLQRIRFNLSYTNHVSLGAGAQASYGLADRDFLSISGTYNF